jgi:hypothetical protein
VEQVEIDFSAKTATVTMQEGRTLNKEECEKAFAGSRYAVTSLKPATANP